MTLKLRPPPVLSRIPGLILQNFSVSPGIHTVPECVSPQMNWRWFLSIQSCCNLLEINQKYTNSYISKPMMHFEKPSGPTICFFEKSRFAKLHRKPYGKFGLLWNFLFGYIPNTVIRQSKRYSIDVSLRHIVLPHKEMFYCHELTDLRLIG
jgi:hypothetical protein